MAGAITGNRARQSKGNAMNNVGQIRVSRCGEPYEFRVLIFFRFASKTSTAPSKLHISIPSFSIDIISLWFPCFETM